MAKEVSRQLSTTTARICSQVRLCGIYGGHNDTFLLVLLFPLPILIQPIALSYGAGTTGQKVTYVPSVLSLTAPQETKEKLQ
jgi:hypothetical protein